MPLVQWELFLNNHDEVAKKITALLDIQNEGLGDIRFYELMPDEAFEDCPLATCEVTPSALRGILAKHADERDRL